MLLTITTDTHAQSNLFAHYQGEVKLGHSFGVGTFAVDRFNLDVIQGVKCGEYFFTGVGVGLDYYYNYKGVDNGEIAIPLFVDSKWYIPITKRFAPYIDMNLGYAFGITEGVDGSSGLRWALSMGAKIMRVQIQCGYVSQRISENGIGIDFNGIQLGIGITF